jgi:SAM-dependent methyltransferase
MTDALKDFMSIWDRKPILRTIYDDFYRRIGAARAPGLTIEIGGGIGNLKQRLGNVVTTDIQFAPWLDCVADAQHLPFDAGSAANIVMVDVLHHIEFPTVFFREAERVLRPGGRIIMVEPAITWGSTLIYRLLHHEPVRTSADPLIEGTPDPNRDPYESNQAIPTLIATRDRNRFHGRFPTLKISRTDWFAFLVYPLSGGFQPWSFMPQNFAGPALAMERKIEGIIGRFTAFRMMLIIEKREAEADLP